MIPNIKISPNFFLYEFLESDNAERNPSLKEEQFSPPDKVVENLKYHVITCMQPLRDDLKYLIKILSGWRSKTLNSLVGGSPSSQHPEGEASDNEVPDSFLTDPRTKEIRSFINDKVKEITGLPIRLNVNANAYLFALACLRINVYDIDQVIHEYGEKGSPKWVHTASSKRMSRREIKIINDTENKVLTLKEALLLLC